MLSSEAFVFDFPEQDPEEIQEPLKPHLVLVYDSEAKDFVDVVDVSELAIESEEGLTSQPIERGVDRVPSAYRLYSLRLDEYPRLTPAQEHALTQKLGTGDTDANYQMLVGNQRLVIKLAKLHSTNKLDLMDFVQAGMLGLARAIEDFDQQRSLRKASDFLLQEFRRMPTSRELADFINSDELDETEVERLRAIGGRTISLDASLGNDHGISLHDLLSSSESSPYEQAARHEVKNTVQHLMDKHLDDREKFIIRHYFGMNSDHTSVSLRELANRIGRSHQRTTQIKNEALEKLRGPITELRAGAEVPDL
jgi:RNA polymerase nonessential primary-like sigma factor